MHRPLHPDRSVDLDCKLLFIVGQSSFNVEPGLKSVEHPLAAEGPLVKGESDQVFP